MIFGDIDKDYFKTDKSHQATDSRKKVKVNVASKSSQKKILAAIFMTFRKTKISATVKIAL